LVVIGAGGHAASVIDVIRSAGRYRIVKLVDPKYLTRYGISCLQDDSKLKKYCQNAGVELGAIGIGSVFDWKAKLRGIELLKSIGLTAPWIISKYAYVSPSAKLGWGVVIHHHAVVNAEAVIGEYCTINTGAIVEHGVTIGNLTHIAPGAIILGDAKIGEQCFIGAGVVVPPGREVEANTILGMKGQEYETLLHL